MKKSESPSENCHYLIHCMLLDSQPSYIGKINIFRRLFGIFSFPHFLIFFTLGSQKKLEFEKNPANLSYGSHKGYTQSNVERRILLYTPLDVVTCTWHTLNQYRYRTYFKSLVVWAQWAQLYQKRPQRKSPYINSPYRKLGYDFAHPV